MRSLLLWTLAAVAGLLIAAGITLAASSLSSQSIGLSSEPLTAGEQLAPERTATSTATTTPQKREKRRAQRKATPSPTAAPTAVPTAELGDDHGGGGHGSGGGGSGKGGGGHGSDD
jgi:hypothetical protein